MHRYTHTNYTLPSGELCKKTYFEECQIITPKPKLMGRSPTQSFVLPDSSSSDAVPRPDRGGMGSRHRLYWAKGTGFGTGSTTSEWNMDAMRAKQKSEEKHVCLVFAILWECLARPEGCGQGAESWCDSALADLLASSCLLPALATYLVNDSSKISCLSLSL